MGIEYPRTSWLRKSVRVSPSGRRIVHQTVRVYLWELSSLFKSLNRIHRKSCRIVFFFETPANVFLKITPPPPTKPQTNNQKQYMHA